MLVLPEVYRILVFWEMTSGIFFGILYLCLVRQRILFVRQSTELFEDAHIFSPCLSEMTMIVSVFSAELGSTADTCAASVFEAFWKRGFSLGVDFMFVSVFCAELDSSADTCTS